MTNKDKVLSALLIATLCDGCLSLASGVKPRQQVYMICTDLCAKRLIYRHHGKCDHCHKAKLTNRLPGVQQTREKKGVTILPTSPETVDARPWYWEGNVQAQVVSYLAYDIPSSMRRIPHLAKLARTSSLFHPTEASYG